jgi:hypothetical protein
MRERRTLHKLQKIIAAQTALRSASQVALNQALDIERAREADVRHAQSRFDEAIEDWRGALKRQAVDASLLRLFAQAPRQRESELNAAEAARAKAQAHCDAHRVSHGEITAQLRRSGILRERARKRLDRKQEEKALSTLEHLMERVGT